jgi:ElaB/YqjD/DUF883 family membrane-anchored ribosome-binding protein
MDMSGKQTPEMEQKQQPLSEQAKDMGAAVKDRANEALATAKEKGKDLMDGGRKMMGDLEQKAGDAVASVGGQVRKAAGTLRERLPHEGMIGSAAESVAGTLESGATYLEEHDLRAMADDVAGVIRTHPIQSVLIGIGIGFLLGRTLRS